MCINKMLGISGLRSIGELQKRSYAQVLSTELLSHLLFFLAWTFTSTYFGVTNLF